MLLLALLAMAPGLGQGPANGIASADTRTNAGPALAATGTARDPGDTTTTVEGWTVRVRGSLWRDQREATQTALALLAKQLAEIGRVVPAPALARLREVPLWMSPEYPGIPPKAEYHPGREWLLANHRDPAMAKGIEFTNVRDFAAETDRMPNFALHELAHAYHDRVLGFDHAGIRAAYENARASGRYDRVERWSGTGRPKTFERAYAMTNEREYFAESTEAYFSRNDFYPFTRVELQSHDPAMAGLLPTLWNRRDFP
jgi:hypothetical protein